MNTDLYEHFSNIDVKEWDIYQHNIGLQGGLNYKLRFFARYRGNLYLYTNQFTEEPTLRTIQTGIMQQQVGVSPLADRFVISSADTNKNTTLSILRLSDGSLVSSVVLDTNGNISIDISKDGTIYAYNQRSGLFRVFDKNGIELNKFNFLLPNESTANNIYWNERYKLIFFQHSGSNKATQGFYRIENGSYELVSKYDYSLPVNTNKRSDFISGDRFIGILSGYSIRIYSYDISSLEGDPQLLATVDPRVNLSVSGTVDFLLEKNNKLYFYLHQNLSRYIFVLDDQFNKVVYPLTQNHDYLAITDRYLFTYLNRVIEVRSVTDFSLVGSFNTTYDIDTAGNLLPNFYNYPSIKI